ncbi:hypothetical protein B0H66DRAFT_321806 [Apodospora peruviana]|uniref:Uncharacterized protein n=1 Tax=Apodospora peruviana TaxID=516989 RepID=A0AAE0M0J9_9PEZI|nr:hypothetical protein B0H66DRAFT_321806 [Apodospora peruviana]
MRRRLGMGAAAAQPDPIRIFYICSSTTLSSSVGLFDKNSAFLLDHVDSNSNLPLFSVILDLVYLLSLCRFVVFRDDEFLSCFLMTISHR